MKIVTFRYQKFNSAIYEAKKRSQKQQPIFPFGQIGDLKDQVFSYDKEDNLQQIQKIGQSKDIIIGSWQ